MSQVNEVRMLKLCLTLLCVGAILFFASGAGPQAAAAACSLSNACPSRAASETAQPRINPAARDLHNILSAADASSAASLKADSAGQLAAPELSFTPTYTMFLPLVAIPPGLPLAPAGLTVTLAATGSIELSWMAAADGGSPVLSYTLSYTPGNVSLPESANCPAGICHATVSSLSNCVAYTFTVNAINAFGSGPSSAPAAGIPVQASDPPAQPTYAYPTSLGASISLSWLAPNAHGCALDLYEVQAYRSAALVTSLQTAFRAATLTGLTTCAYPTGTCGVGYTFYVRAHNAGGWSGNSPGIDATPKVSYLADNLRGIWNKTYGAYGTCTGCHTSGMPNLANTGGNPPADYSSSASEGARMYTCPAHEPSCPGIMTGYSLFSVGSTEYNTVRQWVADGSYQ